jgi:hypothetical protein
MALTADDDPMIVAVALSQKPIIGRSSGYEIP